MERDPLPVEDLLADAVSGEQGWSEPYGGPDGVERLATQMLDELAETSRLLGELRAFALVELLRTHSVADLARSRGVTRQAIEKVAKRAPGTIPW